MVFFFLLLIAGGQLFHLLVGFRYFVGISFVFNLLVIGRSFVRLWNFVVCFCLLRSFVCWIFGGFLFEVFVSLVKVVVGFYMYPVSSLFPALTQMRVFFLSIQI